jgi:hypothetical protein
MFFFPCIELIYHSFWRWLFIVVAVFFAVHLLGRNARLNFQIAENLLGSTAILFAELSWTNLEFFFKVCVVPRGEHETHVLVEALRKLVQVVAAVSLHLEDSKVVLSQSCLQFPEFGQIGRVDKLVHHIELSVRIDYLAAWAIGFFTVVFFAFLMHAVVALRDWITLAIGAWMCLHLEPESVGLHSVNRLTLGSLVGAALLVRA